MVPSAESSSLLGVGLHRAAPARGRLPLAGGGYGSAQVKTSADSRPKAQTGPTSGRGAPSAGDMKYGVDLIFVEARNQPTRVLSGEGGDVYAATTSLLDDLGHDR